LLVFLHCLTMEYFDASTCLNDDVYTYDHGRCVMTGDCYNSNADCYINVLKDTHLWVKVFSVEDVDIMYIYENTYTGTDGPDGVHVQAGDDIYWETDNFNSHDLGFDICADLRFFNVSCDSVNSDVYTYDSGTCFTTEGAYANDASCQISVLERCLVDVNSFDLEADVDYLNLMVEDVLDAEYTGTSSPHDVIINEGNAFLFTSGGGAGNGFDICCYYVPPSESPTLEPIPPPTEWPTHPPVPTEEPTEEPTRSPTLDPTMAPTHQPSTADPTANPTMEPSHNPTTPEPTHDPTTPEPTNDPTIAPTNEPTAIPTVDNDFELGDGTSNLEGIVWLNGQPICNEGWDGANAIVVCRALGFDKGVPLSASTDEQVYENFIMHEVNCMGTETSIWDCEFEVDLACTSEEAAGVVCSNHDPDVFSDMNNVFNYLILPIAGFIALVILLVFIIQKNSNKQEKEKKVQQVIAASPLPSGVEEAEVEEGEGHQTNPWSNITAGDQETPREGDEVTRTLTPVIRLTPRKTSSKIAL